MLMSKSNTKRKRPTLVYSVLTFVAMGVVAAYSKYNLRLSSNKTTQHKEEVVMYLENLKNKKSPKNYKK